ncbi:hypothetical protein BV22DRAFT_999261 [Leucogyrophana mollusca]|uniref:Uncharacterized protein n=1 Tax=Leucogyrophana mollusca TaxID=85980 RepID=A0ACB8C065_9AGAM|nr:hypothetical protein BV22DRAFT_999261 [Leucogyrophana mollusca]
MADFVQGLDPGKLVFAETVLSFVVCPFTVPAYNLPIFLFGTYVHESSDAVQSLKTFTGILSVSVIYDIIWMAQNTQNGLLRMFSLIILLLKLPTTAAFLLALRQRGSQFPGLGTDISGPTGMTYCAVIKHTLTHSHHLVWSMPGGFTSTGREGYQTVDDEPRAPPPQVKVHAAPPPPPPTGGTQPGAYQSV